MKSEVWWCVLVLLGVSGVDTDEVSVFVMEGDSVTLHTDVTANQHETIKFYFFDIKVVEISKGQINICTYNECKKIFGNRLKLDNQTGSLTITNINTTDSGLYHLEIINSGSNIEKTFNVTVNGVSAPEDHQKKRNPVKEREHDSGLPPAAVAGICVAGVLVAAAAAGVIYYRKRPQPVVTGTRTQHSNQVKGVAYSSVKHADNGSVPAANGRLHNGHESAATNETSV